MAEGNLLHKVTEVQHLFLTDYEKNFDATIYHGWMQHNWNIAIYLAICYVLTIFTLKKYMTSKERLNLRGIRFVWNVCLAIFSIIGTIRTVPELYSSLSNHGFVYSVCNRSFFYGPTGLWTMLFTFSKAVELGDTLFIVFCKQKLLFLHWFHHMTTMVFTFHANKESMVSARWMITVNYLVHAFMYTYYTLAALKIRVPKFIKIFITTLQISQMLMVGYVVLFSVNLIRKGNPCQFVISTYMAALAMYIAYFILFMNFFYRTYIQKSKTN